MNYAFEQFLIASCLIQEGNRCAACVHLRKALRAIDKCKKPDLEIRADIAALLQRVEFNVREAS